MRAVIVCKSDAGQFVRIVEILKKLNVIFSFIYLWPALCTQVKLVHSPHCQIPILLFK